MNKAKNKIDVDEWLQSRKNKQKGRLQGRDISRASALKPVSATWTNIVGTVLEYCLGYITMWNVIDPQLF